MAARGAELRLFAAVDLPEGHLQSIALALEPLRGLLPEARWTAPDKWHVTLKFFGEVPDERVPKILEAVRRAAGGAEPIESSLGEPGAFPNPRRARVVWMGIADPEGRLAKLAEAIGTASGLPEEGPFRPHLTLARFKSPTAVGRFIDSLKPAPWDRSAFLIDRAKLVRSRISSTGASYEMLEEFPL